MTATRLDDYTARGYTAGLNTIYVHVRTFMYMYMQQLVLRRISSVEYFDRATAFKAQYI